MERRKAADFEQELQRKQRKKFGVARPSWRCLAVRGHRLEASATETANREVNSLRQDHRYKTKVQRSEIKKTWTDTIGCLQGVAAFCCQA